jgi:hypothetical protein
MYKKTKLNTKSKMKTKIKNKKQKICNRRFEQLMYRVRSTMVIDHLLMYHYLIGTYDNCEKNNTPLNIKNARKFYNYEWKDSLTLQIQITGERTGPIIINPRDFYGFLPNSSLLV